ncbi:putative RNA-binding Zn-ribbon protein involved in translation (DUF1610 family) [Bradyrhizobium sp. LA7.1]
MKNTREILESCRKAELARNEEKRSKFGPRAAILRRFGASCDKDGCRFKCTNCGAQIMAYENGQLWNQQGDCPTAGHIISELAGKGLM